MRSDLGLPHLGMVPAPMGLMYWDKQWGESNRKPGEGGGAGFVSQRIKLGGMMGLAWTRHKRLRGVENLGSDEKYPSA